MASTSDNDFNEEKEKRSVSPDNTDSETVASKEDNHELSNHDGGKFSNEMSRSQQNIHRHKTVVGYLPQHMTTV